MKQRHELKAIVVFNLWPINNYSMRKVINLVESNIKDEPPVDMPVAGPEKLIGKNNLLPIHFLREGVEAADAVCKLEYTGSDGREYVASGFMISENLLLTNHHVFSNPEEAKSANAIFRFEKGNNGVFLNPKIYTAKPDTFFMTNSELDFSIVYLNNSPAKVHGTITLKKRHDKVLLFERVNIIQHPAGQDKKISLQDNKVVTFFESKLHYLADTMGGSSGSPVFNNSWELVALHHAGSNTHNVGIRISAICSKIEELINSTPNAFGKEKLAKELLNSIH